ncbi:MAG: phage tail tape measure protein [Methylobacterium sp.]|uniref:phage tail tape measure protein n=1 Tax=Methylobacterium sp. TaxID=409 RepID=UPI00271CA1E6|nr:phage tail tape measure protein [Methylobacterium sp.]MDO9426036.1 phage tail tape measure protein [Methylobacterium sp.]
MSTRTATLIANLVDQVSGPAKGMAEALKGTASALDALKAKAGKIDAFKQASKSLDDAAQKFRLAQQNVRKIKAEMEAGGDGAKKLGSALKSAERNADAARAAFKSQGQEVRALRGALEQAGVPLNALAAHERQLQTQINHTTEALKRRKKALADVGAGAAAGRMGPAAGGHAPQAGRGGGAGSAVVGAGVARFGAAAAGIGGGAYIIGDQIRRAAKSSMDFERSMIEVGKATDASGGDLEKYSEGILALARATGKTKEDLASMLSSAGFAGRPKEELMNFTEYAAKATVAWGTSAEDTGQALAEIGNIYDANQKRIEEIGDAINTMADSSASKESDLLDFMRRAGASSKQAGISAEHMLAFGASMKEVGVRTDVAATGFEALLNVMKLGKEFSKKAGDGLKELGIDSTKMRKAFVAKPVETMVDLLEKINKVADPLKRAEIMTNLFGKEYQDDIAKMLNALPKVSKYIDLMSDKAKIAAGGVRFQFGQNLDKDVSKIDRATQSIDVLYKRIGDPIKIQIGSVSEQVNTLVDSLEKGDTILQRLVKRLNGGEAGKPIELPEMNGEGGLEKWFEEKLPWLSGKKWNDEVDKRIGKTGADTDRMNREDADGRRAAEERAVLDRPADIENKIQGQRLAQDQARREAVGATGMRRSVAVEQIGKSDVEVKRLEGELAKAWEAIGELRAGQKRDKGAFGVDGPAGKDVEAIGPGRFGLGLHGTDALPSRRVPLPPPRPPELDAAATAVPLPPPRPAGLTPAGADITMSEIKVEVDSSGFDEANRKADELGARTITPKGDGAGLAPIGTAADEAKAKLAEIGGITVAPQSNTAGIDAVTASARQAAAALREVIALGGQAQATIGRVNAASAGNAGGGARTGKVSSALSGAYSDTGMG